MKYPEIDEEAYLLNLIDDEMILGDLLLMDIESSQDYYAADKILSKIKDVSTIKRVLTESEDEIILTRMLQCTSYRDDDFYLRIYNNHHYSGVKWELINHIKNQVYLRWIFYSEDSGLLKYQALGKITNKSILREIKNNPTVNGQYRIYAQTILDELS
ncbi:MAG: hypothetical protein INQ03_24285 [Candidatus Heimdallarchaeota archaeon]|nr:hypothetical protein [Candidatus Heimdallarchaeota archaeon]